MQQLERERLGRSATAAERGTLFPEPDGWEHAPVVDVLDLDLRRPLVEQVERWAGRAGRPVATTEQLVREVLRGIAWAVARTVADLEAAGLAAAAAGLWICGGGVRVRALTAWVEELTGWPVELGPVAASAVGGVLGTASVVRPDVRPYDVSPQDPGAVGTPDARRAHALPQL